MLTVTRVLAVVFVALALVPAGAHLLELPNKIYLPSEQYRGAQNLYRGWAFMGFFVIGALLFTLALAIIERDSPRSLLPAAIAFVCLAGTQVIFWLLIYPVNQLTANWTMMPDNWPRLRMRWECSHAANAALNLGALIAVTYAVVRHS